MASACVNNIAMSPENFLDCPPATYPSYGWLSPRISFSRDDDPSKLSGPKPHSVDKPSGPPDKPDPEPSAGDFEFHLEDPVTMLPADELFSDGKLVPLQLSWVKHSINGPSSPEIRSLETAKVRRSTDMSVSDPHLFSPKAPSCSSRWRELLGLKKLYQSTNGKSSEAQKTTSASNTTNKSLKFFLHRSSKSSSSSSSDASLSLPLLKDLDCESVSISTRLSLSSSSSGHEHEDLPRLSLDSDMPNPNPISIHRNPNPAHPRIRLVKPRAGSFANNNQRSSMDHPAGARVGRSPIRRAPGEAGGVGSRGVSVDSPRMNSSGKIVFQSLERSSSSPSSFNGGPRFKHRAMERSYSANVRVTPVLNVPVCSLRGSSKTGSIFGLGQLFSSPQKKDGAGNGGSCKSHQQINSNGRLRCDRN